MSYFVYKIKLGVLLRWYVFHSSHQLKIDWDNFVTAIKYLIWKTESDIVKIAPCKIIGYWSKLYTRIPFIDKTIFSKSFIYKIYIKGKKQWPLDVVSNGLFFFLHFSYVQVPGTKLNWYYNVSGLISYK